MSLRSFSGHRTLRLSLVSLIVLSAIGWFGIAEVEQELKKALQSQLVATLSANREVLEKWFKEQQNDVATFASMTATRRHIVSLAEKVEGKNVSREFLLKSEEIQQLRDLLRPIVERYGYLGFVVFDRSGMQIAALLDSPVGLRDFVDQSDFVRRALGGETVVSLPFLDKNLLPTSKGELMTNLPTMFVASPVYDNAGEIVAVLSFRIRPEIEYTRVMESSRAGETGETFAFNSEGMMISDSRFTSQLRTMGIIGENDHAILHVQLIEPDAKSSTKSINPEHSEGVRPLTRLVASAIKGESGVDVDGFRDYRGVTVIGAWTWLKEYGFGLATKIDASEAFSSLYILKQLFLKVLAFLTLVMVIALSLQARHARARQSLMLSEERNRSVVSSALDAIITIQADGTVESYNLAAGRLFGYEESEVVGRNVSMLMPEPYRSEHNGYLHRYLRTGETRVLGFPREAVGLRKDGKTVPIELSASEMKLSDRKMFIGIIRDLTERKKAENAIRKKTIGMELLQGVAVAANEAKTVEEAMQTSLDHICRIIRWPVGHVYFLKQAELSKSKSGFISDEKRDLLVPTTLWHMGNPEKHKMFRVVTEDTPFVMGVGLPGRVWAGGVPEWIVDVTRDPNFPRAFGREALGIRTGFAFPVFMGEAIVAVLEFFTDEKVDPDDELLDVMVHLGTQLGRVVERKRALDDLRFYAEDLEKANEEMRDFTFIASHDLQEPLRKIVIFGDRLSVTSLQCLDEQGRLYLGRMQNASHYALGFIHDLLAYSKVTSETESPKPLHLEKVVAEIIAEVQESIDQAGARIEVKSLPVIEATKLQARQLFYNLISNALKFRRKDVALRVTIDAEKFDLYNLPAEIGELPNGLKVDAGNMAPTLNRRSSNPQVSRMYWRITVADNGIGFDEKYSNRIFKPFKRLHGRDLYPGSGMGLAICQKIVSRLDGGIMAKGIPDVGAKFMVYLPEKFSH